MTRVGLTLTGVTEERMLTTRQVAERTGFSMRTVRGWRDKRGGPPYIDYGGSFRYEASELEHWIESRRKGGE